MSSTRIPDAVRRIFTETFTARDVAEPLVSFDAEVASADVRGFMSDKSFDVVGIRGEGQVVGFVQKSSLGNDTCGQFRRPLEEATVLSDNAPLLTVLMKLNHAPFVLITLL